jgi:hypothetical protein
MQCRSKYEQESYRKKGKLQNLRKKIWDREIAFQLGKKIFHVHNLEE